VCVLCICAYWWFSFALNLTLQSIHHLIKESRNTIDPSHFDINVHCYCLKTWCKLYFLKFLIFLQKQKEEATQKLEKREWITACRHNIATVNDNTSPRSASPLFPSFLLLVAPLFTLHVNSEEFLHCFYRLDSAGLDQIIFFHTTRRLIFFQNKLRRMTCRLI